MWYGFTMNTVGLSPTTTTHARHRMRSGLRIRPTWIERAFAFAGGCRTTYRIAESTAAAAASFAACSQLLLPPICGCCSPMYRSRNVAASSATGWMGRRSEGLATMSREGGADGRSQQEENWTGGGASAERSVAAQITRRSREADVYKVR